MSDLLERRAIISGVGLSETGRRVGRSGLALALDAATAAIADAGLTLDDIDGLSSMGQALPDDVKDSFGLRLEWMAPQGGHGQGAGGHLRYVVNAVMAVATGLCRHVLVYRSVSMLSGEFQDVSGDAAWHLPFHDYSAASMVGMHARRHMHEYGTTREQLGAIAVTSRAHAALNEQAALRDPITLDDYLNARWIVEPFGLLDCDIPIDGAVAVIVSAADHADDCPNRPVRFEAVACATYGKMSWDQRDDDYTSMGVNDSVAQMWRRTDLKPDDVDVIEVYDGFTYLALNWIENLGFCKKGEGGPFVEGGHRIRLGGELPMNTYGGQLSAGRLHGYWLLHEAVLQVQGRAGPRQVPDVEVAIAAAGGGPNTGCLLLTR